METYRMRRVCLYVSTDTIIDFAKVVLKINIFTFGKKILSILFMEELEGEIIKESEYKPYLPWRYIDDIIFLWENKLIFFIDKINKVYPTMKFTGKW